MMLVIEDNILFIASHLLYVSNVTYNVMCLFLRVNFLRAHSQITNTSGGGTTNNTGAQSAEWTSENVDSVILKDTIQ